MGAKSKAKAEPDATLISQGASADELTANCPDLEQWPRSWMYEERDLSHGQQMVECFKPFLRHLVSSGPSRKTLRSHRDNLWILGGEIISKLHEDPRDGEAGGKLDHPPWPWKASDHFLGPPAALDEPNYHLRRLRTGHHPADLCRRYRRHHLHTHLVLGGGQPF
jgi:hypothetical protein